MPKTILVADDDTKFIDRLADLLKEQRFNILTAYSGKEAIELFEKNKIDVVLLDWRFPQSDLDGIEVLKIIKSQNKGATVIMMSGYGDDHLIVLAIKNGASDYMRKPIGPKKVKLLIEMIDRYSQAQNENDPFTRTFRRKLEIAKNALSKRNSQKNNPQKGKTLEELAMFVLSNIDNGIVVDKKRNIRTYTNEIDLYVRNESKDIVWHEIFGPQCIVECKNWKKTVGSRDILAFFGLLSLNKVKAGIFFTTSKITGNSQKDAGLILRGARNIGTNIIVIDGHCLEEINEGKHPSIIVKNKYHELFQI
jgi:DNA-binding response OmpR family regulator